MRAAALGWHRRRAGAVAQHRIDAGPLAAGATDAKIAAMRLVLLAAASLALAAQAAVGAAALWGITRSHLGLSFEARCCATTAWRITRVLGADAAALDDLRSLPPGTVLACHDSMSLAANVGSLADLQRVPPERIQQLNARNGLLVQWKQLLFPPRLLLALPQPVEAVENEVRAGRAAVLCLLPGDPEPTSRAGWKRTLATPRVQVWTFRTE